MLAGAAARNHHRLQQISRGAAAMATCSKTDQQEGNKSTWTKLKVFFLPALCFFRGTDLLFSIPEKPELVESRLNMEAVEINDESLKNMEFRKVKCKGFFDEKKSILVVEDTPTDSDPFAYEYSLRTPLIPHPQSVSSSGVVVNRGRVPRDWADYTKIEKLQSYEIVREFPMKEKLLSASPVESVGVVGNSIVLKLQKRIIPSANPRPRPRPRPQPQPIELVGVIRSGESLGGGMGLDPAEATLYVEQIEDKSGNSANMDITLYDEAHMLARFAHMRNTHIQDTIFWYCTSAGLFHMTRWLSRIL